MATNDLKFYDNYEISPCQRLDEAGLPDPNGLIYEVCDPDEADVWTLYGHITGEGAQAIGDFASRGDAEDTFQRITGISFSDTRAVADRIRLMHTAPKLLRVAEAAWRRAENREMLSLQECTELCAAIMEATGGTAGPRPSKPVRQ
jgi:hypothetical protein